MCNCDKMILEHGVWYWRSKPLTLQIDHINGHDGEDADKAGNLRRLCANCHSQTDNFRVKGTQKFIQKSNAVAADIDPSAAVYIGPDVDAAVAAITSGDNTSAVVSIGPDIDAAVATIARGVKRARPTWIVSVRTLAQRPAEFPGHF